MTELDTPTPAATLESLGVTVDSVFVPFSESRSAGQDMPNLNWRVTIKRNGRDVLTTDYSAGLAHCPGYNAPRLPSNFTPRGYRTRKAGGGYTYRQASPGEALKQYQEALARAECESGLTMRLGKWGQNPGFEPIGGRPGSTQKNRRIEPNPVDVLYSLTMDSDVLDSGGFEEWAACFGYDTDSRKAESIYRACLEIALQMRAAFGDSGMAALQSAFQDY